MLWPTLVFKKESILVYTFKKTPLHVRILKLKINVAYMLK